MPSSLIVTPDPTNPQRGALRHGARSFACVLGRSGIRADKHEGDGATPAGVFALRRVLYRADRLPTVSTKLPLAPIAPGDGWCDAPADARYNQPVKLPYSASAESMWRDDGLYDVVVVLGHNDDPVVPEAGSAIFVHVAAPDRAPTEGCVALAREDLLAVLAAAVPGTLIEIKNA
jgi:L,D-peptidoglycan transpeptidase YkuD (ErfK/YbiS/YcfS/YnhG family)